MYLKKGEGGSADKIGDRLISEWGMRAYVPSFAFYIYGGEKNCTAKKGSKTLINIFHFRFLCFLFLKKNMFLL